MATEDTPPTTKRRGAMSDKIRPQHVARKAMLYIRQSSAYQVKSRQTSPLGLLAYVDTQELPCSAHCGKSRNAGAIPASPGIGIRLLPGLFLLPIGTIRSRNEIKATAVQSRRRCRSSRRESARRIDR